MSRTFTSTSLPTRLHSHHPPALNLVDGSTGGGSGGGGGGGGGGAESQSGTRNVTQATLDVFARAAFMGRDVDDDQPEGDGITFSHDDNILHRLAEVLFDAWRDDPNAYTDPAWDLLTSIHSNFHRWTATRGEVLSLSATFEHQLFGLINFMLDPGAGPRNFKDEYYESRADGSSRRARWDKGRKSDRVEADHAVIRTIADYLTETMVVMEKKMPKSMSLNRVMRIVFASKQGEGFKLTVDGGNLCCDRVEIDQGGLQQIGQVSGGITQKEGKRKSVADVIGTERQLVEYMDTYNIPIGVLTNYECYALLVRKGRDRISVSDIVYRDYHQQFPSSSGAGSASHHMFDMTPLELLLALCLYPLQDKVKLADEVYVKKVRTQVSPTTTKKQAKSQDKVTSKRQREDKDQEGEGGVGGPSEPAGKRHQREGGDEERLGLDDEGTTADYQDTMTGHHLLEDDSDTGWGGARDLATTRSHAERPSSTVIATPESIKVLTPTATLFPVRFAICPYPTLNLDSFSGPSRDDAPRPRVRPHPLPQDRPLNTLRSLHILQCER